MIYLQDSDFTLHLGDVLDVLREMPSDSVDCVITSPPYWGLRDYGTGAWAGGDAECDHVERLARNDPERPQREGWERKAPIATSTIQFRATCGKCGATRQDAQLGLESTPEQYVERMTEVFREVRRVLAAHGTCWLNMGDSYASSPPGNVEGVGKTSGLHGANDASGKYRETLKAGHATKRNTVVGGLKPKDLCGIPWRLAFALQADGWYLRSDIVWSKPNPMPESVTDRPTKAHEYVFLLTKSPRYFFDQEAVREGVTGGANPQGRGYGVKATEPGQGIKNNHSFSSAIHNRTAADMPTSRNIRSVWEIATQPYPEAHFATFPEELVRRCLLAGCPEQVCGECGKARERVVEAHYEKAPGGGYGGRTMEAAPNEKRTGPMGATALYRNNTTLGFTDCGHDAYHPGTVLDPFMGSGTTALVARKHSRRAVGIELNAEYCELIVKRTQQLSLLSV